MIGERGVVGEEVMAAATVAAIDEVGADDLNPAASRMRLMAPSPQAHSQSTPWKDSTASRA